MSGPGFAVASGVLLVGGLGIYLVLGPMREPPGLRGASEARPADSDQIEEPLIQPEDHSQSSRPPASSRVAPGPPAATPFAESKVGAERPFPLARDLPVGTERSEVLRLYGAPAMRTASLEQGVPVETMVYLRRHPEAATFILLRAGRVASGSTTNY